jgi:putative acetyltransferase
MEIRPIQPSDNVQIKKIIQTNLENFALDIPGTAYFDPELDTLFNYYRQHQPAKYYVLEGPFGKIYGGVGVAKYNRDKGIAELQKLYIDPTEQGNGYSKGLMEAAIKFAKQHYQILYLETHSSLKAAVHIYEEYGFEWLSKPLSGSPHSTMDMWAILRL